MGEGSGFREISMRMMGYVIDVSVQAGAILVRQEASRGSAFVCARASMPHETPHHQRRDIQIRQQICKSGRP